MCISLDYNYIHILLYQHGLCLGPNSSPLSLFHGDCFRYFISPMVCLLWIEINIKGAADEMLSELSLYMHKEGRKALDIANYS